MQTLLTKNYAEAVRRYDSWRRYSVAHSINLRGVRDNYIELFRTYNSAINT